MTAPDSTPSGDQAKRRQRRKLLATLGLGLTGAYVAPTLFSLGQAQAWDGRGRRRSRPSRPRYSRPSYSRPSYSRPSRYHGHRRGKRDRRYEDRRYWGRDERYDRHVYRRVDDYRDDPARLVEDLIFGPPGRW
ncbi:hypothetical protein [Halomonas salifodinae]|uniref:hypothetical protein n=1 Tax=Halomonas salifodinae TaxID=438745 RepID=UPI0033BA68C7